MTNAANNCFTLQAKDSLTKFIKSLGIKNWNQLTDFVANLPYGRISNKADFSLVIKERKGTCSSKHTLLKRVADLNNIYHITLILGIYKMNKSNTPKIGLTLDSYKLNYLPEAHCYLKINNERIDFTSKKADINLIKNDILLEREIEAEDVVSFKAAFHKLFLKDWLTRNNINLSLTEIWAVRERCIQKLSS